MNTPLNSSQALASPVSAVSNKVVRQLGSTQATWAVVQISLVYLLAAICAAFIPQVPPPSRNHQAAATFTA